MKSNCVLMFKLIVLKLTKRFQSKCALLRFILCVHINFKRSLYMRINACVYVHAGVWSAMNTVYYYLKCIRLLTSLHFATIVNAIQHNCTSPLHLTVAICTTNTNHLLDLGEMIISLSAFFVDIFFFISFITTCFAPSIDFIGRSKNKKS